MLKFKVFGSKAISRFRLAKVTSADELLEEEDEEDEDDEKEEAERHFTCKQLYLSLKEPKGRDKTSKLTLTHQRVTLKSTDSHKHVQ